MGIGSYLVAVVLSLVLSWLLVGLSLRYAQWRGLMDAPGQRRSHQTPTPRGGGLGLLLASMPVLCWAWFFVLPGVTGCAAVLLLAALLALMLVGWLDDHRNLPNAPRLLVHGLAALVLAWLVAQSVPGWPTWWRMAASLALFGATVWSINLHNFMDGIDALLGSQALFYFSALGAVAWGLGEDAVALACCGLAGATLGFLAYNRPPARIFMGDVGSVTLGWLVAALAVLLWLRQPQTLWVALILASTFVVDASLTLLRRMVSGRRWYTAHREHAYQWLVRSGWNHAQVVAVYLAWNLLVALPAALLALAWPKLGPALLVAVVAAASLAHVRVRHYCRSLRNRRRTRHGAA